jgi:hypothetical protein
MFSTLLLSAAAAAAASQLAFEVNGSVVTDELAPPPCVVLITSVKRISVHIFGPPFIDVTAAEVATTVAGRPSCASQTVLLAPGPVRTCDTDVL